jgi:hypothetical protein
MRTYDNPDVRTYYLGSITFTSSDKLFDFDLAAGENAALKDVEIRVTTTFAGATTTPKILVGTSGDTDAYFSKDYGTTAAGNDVLSAERSYSTAFLGDYRAIPKGTTIRVSAIAATGGGAAGVADVWVTLARW